MTSNIKLLLILTTIIALISCNSTGSKFVGTWGDPHLNRPARDLIIIKHIGGDNYLVKRSCQEELGSHILEDSYISFEDTATLNGDNLVIISTTCPKNFGNKVTLSIVNNNLLFDSKEYEKH